jgi:hypothetical protein
MLYIASIMSRRLHSPSDDILEVGRLAIRLHMQIFFTALPTKHPGQWLQPADAISLNYQAGYK